jgi:hypothetical protein
MFAQGFLVGLFRIAAAKSTGQRCGIARLAFFVHAPSLLFARTGRLLERAERHADMLGRPAWAVLLCLSLCACQEAKADDPTLITGGGAVTVLQSSYVSSGDSQPALGAGSLTYVISSIEFRNVQTVPLYPVISQFVLTDVSGNRYFGIDTGSSSLAGISNDLEPIAPGEARKFVVAFRAAPTTMGTIRYDY